MSSIGVVGDNGGPSLI